MSNYETKECYWCKIAGLTKEEYTFLIDWPGSQDADTAKWICDNCADCGEEEKEVT